MTPRCQSHLDRQLTDSYPSLLSWTAVTKKHWFLCQLLGRRTVVIGTKARLNGFPLFVSYLTSLSLHVSIHHLSGITLVQNYLLDGLFIHFPSLFVNILKTDQILICQHGGNLFMYSQLTARLLTVNHIVKGIYLHQISSLSDCSSHNIC